MSGRAYGRKQVGHGRKGLVSSKQVMSHFSLGVLLHGIEPSRRLLSPSSRATKN